MIPPPRSLALRLAAATALGQLLLAVGLVWVGILFTRRQLSAALDTGLRGRLMSVVAVVRYPESGTGLLFDGSLLPPAARSAYPDFYEVRGPDGARIASTFPADLALPATPAGQPPRRRGVRIQPGVDASSWAEYWQFQYRGTRYRALLLSSVPIMDREEDIPPPPARLAVIYATPLAGIEHQVITAGAAIAGLSLVLLAGSLLFTGWMLRRALRPLHTLAEQAAAISPRHWQFQPSPGTAAIAELRPLIQALERMLQRLHHSYQRQREFLADAAHELKTPVAVLKSTVQSTLQHQREPEVYRGAMSASLQDIERLEYLLQRMLRLARAEQWMERGPSPVPAADLAASCEAALARVSALAEARAVRLSLKLGEAGAAPGRVRGDAEDLELVWVNLLENAVQHSAAGMTVEIEASTGPGGVTVTVSDQGCGIPAAELLHIFERFRRGDATRSRNPDGFGLGLAIARAIVEAYGGAIAASSREDHGTTLRVTLAPAPA